MDLQWLGVTGVFMFFVHTSLVLMWSLDRDSRFFSFYIRRFFRIYPLAVTAIIVLVLFRIPTAHNPQGDTFFTAPSARNLISNLLLIQNRTGEKPILGVMWTLPIEVDMYLFLPFLFLLVRRKNALYAVLLIWIAVTQFNLRFISPKDSGFMDEIPCFLAGVIAFGLFSKLRARIPAALFPVLIAGSVILFLSHSSWRNGWLLSLVLGAALPLFRQIQAKWLIHTSHHIAKYSYGVYLAHPFCITFGLYFLHDYNIVIRIAGIFLLLAAVVVPAYHFLEKPMIDFGVHLTSRTRFLPLNRQAFEEQI